MKKEKLVEKDIDVSYNDFPIYFNDRMTQLNKMLIFKAKTTADGLVINKCSLIRTQFL